MSKDRRSKLRKMRFATYMIGKQIGPTFSCVVHFYTDVRLPKLNLQLGRFESFENQPPCLASSTLDNRSIQKWFPNAQAKLLKHKTKVYQVLKFYPNLYPNFYLKFYPIIYPYSDISIFPDLWSILRHGGGEELFPGCPRPEGPALPRAGPSSPWPGGNGYPAYFHHDTFQPWSMA